MRTRAIVAAASGALALSALALPAAHAAGSAPSFRTEAAKAVAAAGRTTYAASAGSTLNVSFSNFKIATAIKVGTSNHVAVPVTYSMTFDSTYKLGTTDYDNGPLIYKGSLATPDNVLIADNPATCTATSSTTANCTGQIDIYPAAGTADASYELLNSDAGKWTAGALAVTPADNVSALKGDLATTSVQRYSKLTVDASPEPVKKGKTITVTGALTRANWEDNAYHGYTVQPVKLQFRKAGSTTYTTLKTVTSSSTGSLKTTVTATADGYFRYSFAGTSTTPAVSAAGDYVDVQ
ncbi:MULTISPECIES: hypothetical protein [unclassified Streptomyces]|uniref:hypothetical protein n=1 Tax=unclassified Streptomyces TaxID=2593676 RepID=UPI0030D57420